MTGASNTSAYVFDARGISKRFRHAAIFGALESLDRGETMRFVNDHDPIPLLHQIQSRYGDQVAIAYVQRGPEQVVIDFSVTPAAGQASDAAKAGGCGSGSGTSCGCSGG
ncbi:hypothetical protein Busp01_35220 [Trinickia caryophylli]|uniref:Uncharacterized conserved protein, DUF2249 family n=1 Tax=Trinickia caryophylli TaxID=28094 RepID=A0A1X7FSH3_TRICW|nr:hypothetical protein C0Z17_12205 [Trinickia caryophylli]GLU33680.1 hypothetical protein Busp01_35220 [Trinickia caryophylli]SMF57990.1 Uncharacterized conserved protein, DUF2249 family [Trinickia caryophylli]